jgi:aryl-alcohol dehydrogenase-like predicted oxidoreductase
MEYRQLGKSGLKVPELCFGAGTFGAANEFFKAWSETTQEEANRIVDICMDAGMNLFDTADIYSDGESEKALGKALAKHNGEDVISRRRPHSGWAKGRTMWGRRGIT